jgi:hypothetical protein
VSLRSPGGENGRARPPRRSKTAAGCSLAVRALAAMGIRAVIEHIMIEQIGDSGAMGSKISPA